MTDDARILLLASGFLPAELSRVLRERVDVGETRYGRMCLATDPRDLRREAEEELADAVYYLSAWVLRLHGQGLGTVQAMRALRMVAGAWVAVRGRARTDDINASEQDAG